MMFAFLAPAAPARLTRAPRSATCLGAPASAILISLSDSGHEPYAVVARPIEVGLTDCRGSMFEFTFPIETLWTSSASPHTHAVGTDAAIVAWKTSWVDNETFHTNSAVYAIEQGPVGRFLSRRSRDELMGSTASR